MTGDRPFSRLLRAARALHGAFDQVSDQPGRVTQGEGGRQPPLPLPHDATPGDSFEERRAISTMQVGVQLGASAEEDVVGRGDYRLGCQMPAEAVCAATQQWPREGEVAGLFLADHRISLGHPEQSIEAGQQSRSFGQRLTTAGFGGGALFR
jgi:hypothetical protein